MAKSATAAAGYAMEGFVGKLKNWPIQATQRTKSFYTEVRTEMKKVTSPSWKEVRATTVVVIITVFIFGLYFFLVDNAIRGVTYLWHHIVK